MNVLEEICKKKRQHVAHAKAQRSLDDIKSRLKGADKPRGFKAALDAKANKNDIALIAEVKKASPSKGVIRADFDPASIAKAYADNGATCLSVLTDEPYFQGADEYLVQVKEACSLPLLRKDFMVDPYQIYESRMLGADCVLLIMAALDDDEASEMYRIARDLDMDVLVETHDEEEIERSLGFVDALIGVNNRNLKTLDVSLQTGIQFSKDLPLNFFKVAESGIYSNADVCLLKNHGYQAFLVGESLMREDDIGAAVRNLLG